ncbi:MAG: biotin--[acetyl-CoA-carboxylase] ligase [Myxococcota bacterium]
MTDPIAEDLRPGPIQDHLRAERFGRSLDVRKETASTMDDAREVLTTAPDGHVVLADRQQRGRGAHGRSWDSPPGTDLYFSIVTRPALPGASQPLLTLAVGLGVAQAAEGLTGQRAMIKWPNDVWLAGKKCAGVLVESTTRGDRLEGTVIGVGLNVNRRHWPDELKDLATSLAQSREDAASLDRAEVLARTLEGIEQWVDRLVERGAAPVVDALSRRLALVGDEVIIDSVRGVLEGVSETGAARVRTADGVREVLAGTLRAAYRLEH